MKYIPKYPGYAISRDGQVYNLRRCVWLGCKPNHPFGYVQVNLLQDGKRSIRTVHQLVLETYVGPKPDGMECRHLDGNPLNNRLDNLCWGTKSENRQDAVKHGTHFAARGEDHNHAKLTEAEVLVIRQLYKAGGFSQRVLGKLYGVGHGQISLIVNRKNWACVGV